MRRYRYSEWFRWGGGVCAPAWALPSDGVELYSHEGDRTPGCFDRFENVNLVASAAGKCATVCSHIRLRELPHRLLALLGVQT